MKTKKIPMRMCVVCGEMKPKKELIRVLRTPEGEFLLDTTGKKAGRGAYLCKNMACLDAAKKARKLERSFSCRIAPAVYEELEHALQSELHELIDHLPEGREGDSGL